MTGWEIQLLDSSKAKLAVLWNPTGAGKGTVSCKVKEEVEGEDVVEYITPDISLRDRFQDADETHYLRLVNLNDPSEIRTYEIDDSEIVSQHGENLLVVKGTRIWIQLKERYIYPFTRDFSNITISALVSELFTGSGATTDFQVGTIADDTDLVDFISLNHHSVLWALRQVNAKLGRELSIDESTSPITVNLPVSIGDANSKARLRYGTNLQGIRKKVNKQEMFTRMHGVGGGVPSMKLSASSLAGGLDYIDADDFDASENNYVGVYHNPDLEDIENLIPAASHPDLSGTYASGLCTGWAKIGTPAVSENTDGQYIEHGTKSQKVVTGTGEGVSVSLTVPADTELVGWVHLYIEALDPGAVVEVKWTDGSAVFYNGDGLGDVGGFYSEERRGLRFTTTVPLVDEASVDLEITTVFGGGTFYVDAALVSANTEFRKFVIGDMADVLYNETAAELEKKKDPEVTYVADALDLFEIDRRKWPNYQIRLGDTVPVEDSRLSIAAVQRIKKRIWDVIHHENTTFEVGNVIKSLGALMAQDQQSFRKELERSRSGQDRSDRASSSVTTDRPVAAQVAYYSGAFASVAYNEVSWGNGALTVGENLRYTISSDSASGLTASTTYWAYFDLDDPGSGIQLTSTFTASVGPRKASVAIVITGASTEPGLTVITHGRPQLSGDHIVTGTVTVGPSPSDDNRLVMSWENSSFEVYRDGNKVVDAGDVSFGSIAGSYGVEVSDVDGVYTLDRQGDASGLSVPTNGYIAGYLASLFRDTDEAHGAGEQAFRAVVFAGPKTSGANGLYEGYRATVRNDDGPAIGFDASSTGSGTWGVRSDTDARGFNAGIVAATGLAGVAAGIRTGSVEGGSSTGIAAGLWIEDDISGANENFAAYSPSDEDSYFEGAFGIGTRTPGRKLDVNGTGRFAGLLDVDSAMELGNFFLSGAPTDGVKMASADLSPGNTMLAILTEGTPVGSGTPTQNRTVATEVNGTTLYLLAATSAS